MRQSVRTQIKLLRPGTEVPVYKTKGSAGFDVRNMSGEDIQILPGQVKVVPSGFALRVPEGKVGLVTPRSGKSISGFTVNNSPGVIDDDYRDEVGIICANTGNDTVTLAAGERIAQFLVVDYYQLDLDVVDEFSPDEFNDRTGGMGSTGEM